MHPLRKMTCQVIFLKKLRYLMITYLSWNVCCNKINAHDKNTLPYDQNSSIFNLNPSYNTSVELETCLYVNVPYQRFLTKSSNPNYCSSPLHYCSCYQRILTLLHFPSQSICAIYHTWDHSIVPFAASRCVGNATIYRINKGTTK